MSSSPSVVNNHLYHDTSSSSSSLSISPSCSTLDTSQEEFILLNDKSSQKQYDSISNDKNNSMYWSQRSRNNLSAKQSRTKRRMNDFVLETKLTQLTNENEILRAKMNMLIRKFGHLISQKDKQFEYDELTSDEQPTVLNILDQSSTQINHSNNHLSLTTTTEQLSLEKSSIPIKWRFKLLNITSDS
ncbi:unnamed protein product [Rotaria sordida]|uniref:BZIP domain-containing protein n=1 Tax=Rotaria sordida TaxID=392033 RepID=A0A814DTF9_9BILA|nr:unnamed protein product [Rotaria sordida]CAF0962712.1 unnamed protein product [Rotaria sordida]CAF0998338.1 unnamed protein product [Rotaria sordida]CAF1016705.1 unnamed protein product [Rotaria sordida]CAF1019390.1 unnamed protein product [Rotaria sordida]